MGQSKYPSLSPSEVEAILRALGFTARSTEGSHRHYERVKDDSRPRSVVTVDLAEREFYDFLMKNMIRQSNFTRDEFYGATKRTARRASVKLFTVQTQAE